jgi:hypothetical protein
MTSTGTPTGIRCAVWAHQPLQFWALYYFLCSFIEHRFNHRRSNSPGEHGRPLDSQHKASIQCDNEDLDDVLPDQAQFTIYPAYEELTEYDIMSIFPLARNLFTFSKEWIKCVPIVKENFPELKACAAMVKVWDDFTNGQVDGTESGKPSVSTVAQGTKRQTAHFIFKAAREFFFENRLNVLSIGIKWEREFEKFFYGFHKAEDIRDGLGPEELAARDGLDLDVLLLIHAVVATDCRPNDPAAKIKEWFLEFYYDTFVWIDAEGVEEMIETWKTELRDNGQIIPGRFGLEENSSRHSHNPDSHTSSPVDPVEDDGEDGSPWTAPDPIDDENGDDSPASPDDVEDDNNDDYELTTAADTAFIVDEDEEVEGEEGIRGRNRTPKSAAKKSSNRETFESQGSLKEELRGLFNSDNHLVESEFSSVVASMIQEILGRGREYQPLTFNGRSLGRIGEEGGGAAKKTVEEKMICERTGKLITSLTMFLSRVFGHPLEDILRACNLRETFHKPENSWQLCEQVFRIEHPDFDNEDGEIICSSIYKMIDILIKILLGSWIDQVRVWYKAEYTDKTGKEQQECLARWSAILDAAAEDAGLPALARSRELERRLEQLVRSFLLK